MHSAETWADLGCFTPAVTRQPAAVFLEGSERAGPQREQVSVGGDGTLGTAVSLRESEVSAAGHLRTH